MTGAPKTEEAPSEHQVRCYATALRKASRLMSQVYDAALEPSGIKTTQRAILVTVEKRGPLTVNALADALVMDPGGLAHSLKPLVRDRLLSLSVDPHDRRSRLIAIEPEGRARIRASDPLFADAQRRFEDAFGTSEAAGLRAMLGRIVSEELSKSLKV
jgi:DNA-binding MarR family transcriptional regulator